MPDNNAMTISTSAERQLQLAEADALLLRAGVRLRDDLRLVHVRGDDRTSWLNGQLTGDVRHLATGQCVHALCINVRGKILADVWVLARASELCLLLPQAKCASIVEHLEHYIIMEDVTLETDPRARVISVQGPEARALVQREAADVECFPCDELGSGGVHLILDASEANAVVERLAKHCMAVSDPGFELARLRAGVPRFARDYDDTTYPQEAGLKALLSFNKGCYLGQEVVCTLENRGRMHRRLYTLHAPGAHAFSLPTPLTAPGGEAVGDITSYAHDPKLDVTLCFGYVKSAVGQPGVRLQADAVECVVDRVVGEKI